jgi:AbiV family abortive infection protein
VKDRNYLLSVELLRLYRDAALKNAAQLLEEASLLLEHNHHPRAYFLAVAAIEEVGKAVQASDGMCRNLDTSAVSTRLKLQFENHSQKITSAFVPWLLTTPRLRDEIMRFVDVMIDVKHGREPSMYTDIHSDGPGVVTPESAVRPSAAANCVQLGYAVLSHAKPYIGQSERQPRTPDQDALFALKPAVFRKMTNTEDFWQYYISRMESGDLAFETAVMEYHRTYFCKDATFKTQVESRDDT